MTPMTTRGAPVYPTWIRGRRIVACWALAGLIVLVAAVLGHVWTLAFGIALLALPFIYVALLITLTSYRLSSRGDAVQGQIHQLLIDSVGTGGRLLDVGCGQVREGA